MRARRRMSTGTGTGIGAGRRSTESGSGTPLAIGMVACVLLIGVGLLPLYRGTLAVRSLAAVADSAALAGADAASGLEPGFPCERAAQAAALGGARLESCDLSSGIVTVSVSARVLGYPLRVEARAGPPTCVWCA